MRTAEAGSATPYTPVTRRTETALRSRPTGCAHQPGSGALTIAERFWPGSTHGYLLQEDHRMMTDPKLEDRRAQSYVGIRTLAPMQAFSQVIPQSLETVAAWLK